MRLKISPESDKAYSCCCCHVRTGTIVLAVFQLLVSLLAIVMLSFVFFYPESFPTKNTVESTLISTEEPDFIADLVPDPVADVDSEVKKGYADYSYIYDNWSWTNKDFQYENQCFALFITFMFFISIVMLLYGAIKGLSSFLMPYFVIQVFDFALSCLTVLGYASTELDIKSLIIQKGNLPENVKLYLLNLDSHWLTVIVAVVVVGCLMFKAYLISIVWRCYKYLTAVQTATRVVHGMTQYMDGEDTEMLLPPKYEEVIQEEANRPAPPPYTSEAE